MITDSFHREQHWESGKGRYSILQGKEIHMEERRREIS